MTQDEYGWGRKPKKSNYPIKTGMSIACKSGGNGHSDCCALSCTCDCHIVKDEYSRKSPS